MGKIPLQSARFAALATGAMCLVLGSCTKETPPTSVRQYAEDPILLEATMLRCAENRSETKYTAECVNAREAASRIGAARSADRRQELEAQSERKRQALRRAQEAAAQARERTAEAERMRRDAELLGQFETAPPADDNNSGANTNMPVARPTPPDENAAPDGLPAETEPDRAPPSSNDSDPNAVREELQRRQDDDSE